eukprot:174195_1
MSNALHHFHIRYFAQLVLYQILTALQIILIVSTIFGFHQKTKNIHFKSNQLRIYTKMKQLFILVLTMGSLVFFLVEWYGIADFLYDFAAMPYYCDIAAILGNLSLITYLLTLYLFYLYRLWATFHNSAFRLSSSTIRVLLISTFTTYFLMILLVFIFQKGAVKHTLFSWSMKPSEYKPIIICEGEFSIGINPSLRIALQCIVIVGNTFYGYIFYRKLFLLLKYMDRLTFNVKEESSTRDIESEKDVFKLMNKQTTLVLTSTISTSVLWTTANILHYFGSYLQVLIYLDITINCLCLFLMFNWNDNIYKVCCKCCAMLNDQCLMKVFATRSLLRIQRTLSNSVDRHKNNNATNETTSGSLPLPNHDHTSRDITPPETVETEVTIITEIKPK